MNEELWQTVWPAKPKIFAIWAFKKMFAYSWATQKNQACQIFLGKSRGKVHKIFACWNPFLSKKKKEIPFS